MNSLAMQSLRSSNLLRQLRRPLASAAAPSANPLRPSGPPVIFDRNAKKLQRDRASRHPNSRATDYLKDEIANRLVDRILDVKNKYPTIVDLGSGAGHLVKYLDTDITSKVIMCDMSRDLLYRDQELDAEREVEIERRVLDEESNLLSAFEENSLDMIVSNLSMHWVNDLPGMLIQARKCLKPDGVFIGAMFGGDSIFELRTSLQLAELEREGGISPRVSPMTVVADMGGLLSRAGLTLTTVDVDEIVVDYPSPYDLMDDLRAMGESNAVFQRRPLLKRDTLAAASSIYQSMHGNPDGSIPATFQVIYLIGWKPAPTQPKPLARGSGQVNLKKVLAESA
ncbi:S-adenosyl-L-methionine-dependent methyltransferase [Catenaria anguillulae PL171]|uniref:S-adenosyl-L-methionine-dependent methyltransferase n=1 Tax=Catenaria anguillulae PL171 TaxID=765915 RepID=A0A1Y2I0P0_9FUNG|nr:S-adenosyl-L-methionine-dependent methyltransferase [Catenaria anguillulae PL171]